MGTRCGSRDRATHTRFRRSRRFRCWFTVVLVSGFVPHIDHLSHVIVKVTRRETADVEEFVRRIHIVLVPGLESRQTEDCAFRDIVPHRSEVFGVA